MADRDKVITELKAYINYPEPLCRIVKDAIELLKEQEPLVIHNRNFTATCPECHLPWMMWQPDYMRYCPYCGKAVKWDD